MLFNILVICAFLVVLLLLRQLVGIVPSLLACVIRWKESVNLEASVKLSRDRDSIALAMIAPFCLMAYRYRLYSPGFLDGLSENVLLCMYFAVFSAFLLLRFIAVITFRPHRMPKKVFATAVKTSSSFFIICTLILLAACGIMSVLDISDAEIRSAMLWISAATYMLALIRKMQIFSTSCSVFVAFLYLCALEMIPTGILVVSAIIF